MTFVVQRWAISEILLPLYIGLFEGAVNCIGIQNHTGLHQVHSFNPIMYLNNECTTDVWLAEWFAAREYLLYCERHAELIAMFE